MIQITLRDAPGLRAARRETAILFHLSFAVAPAKTLQLLANSSVLITASKLTVQMRDTTPKRPPPPPTANFTPTSLTDSSREVRKILERFRTDRRVPRVSAVSAQAAPPGSRQRKERKGGGSGVPNLPGSLPRFPNRIWGCGAPAPSPSLAWKRQQGKAAKAAKARRHGGAPPGRRS